MRSALLLFILPLWVMANPLPAQQDLLQVANKITKIYPGLQNHQLVGPIDDVIKAALESARGIIKNGIPSANIPPLDPFVVGDLNVNMDNSMANLKVQLRDVEATHLGDFVVEYVKTNMIKFKMDMDLREPVFRIDGHYAMDGTVMSIFPLYGSGDFHIVVTNASIIGGAQMDMSKPAIKNLYLNFTFDNFEVKFEHLMGGGSIEKVIETVIDDLGKEIVNTVWPMISGPLCEVIETVVNSVLSGGNKTSLANVKDEGNANYYLDDILAIVRTSIRTAGLEPLLLPDAYTDIAGGHAALYKGWLMGLSTIHRSGDATIDRKRLHYTLNGTVGFTNLQAGYKVQVSELGVSLNCDLNALVRSTDFFFQAEIQMTNKNVTMDAFEIFFGDIEVEIKGLGPFDWMFDGIADLAISLIKDTLAETLSTVVLELIREAIAGNLP